MTPPECPCPTQYINEGVRNSAIMSTNVCFDNTTARPFTHPNVVLTLSALKQFTLCVEFVLSINHSVCICWTHKYVQSLLLSCSYETGTVIIYWWSYQRHRFVQSYSRTKKHLNNTICITAVYDHRNPHPHDTHIHTHSSSIYPQLQLFHTQGKKQGGLWLRFCSSH